MTRVLNYPPTERLACIAATQACISTSTDNADTLELFEAYCTTPRCVWKCGHRHRSYRAAIRCAEQHVRIAAAPTD